MNAILCLGDSIVFGRGEQPAKGWVGRLKEWYESLDEYNVVYNLGIPGDTSATLLSRIKTEVRSRVNYLREGDTFTVIVGVGTNDLRFNGTKHCVSSSEFETNMERIVDFLRETVDTVVVLQMAPTHSTKALAWEGASYSNADIDTYNQILRTVCSDSFVSLTFTDWDAKLPDGIHPNSEGYDEMFKQIKELFETH